MTISRRFNIDRGYTARSKPVVIHNRIARLQFAKKYLKEPAEVLRTDGTKI